MLESIVEHLKKTYKPNAIILHGSRARGRERKNSDWDFIFLYNPPASVTNGRLLFEKQNIEFSSHILPVVDLEDEFSTKLQGAKVVYEEDGVGTNLLEKANDYYREGVHWPQEKVNDHKLWVQGRIDGMKDSTSNVVVFTKYFADFYQWIFSYWYWIRKHSHSQPIYIAVEEIAKEDSEYLELINKLTDNQNSLEAKVKTAEKIRDHLFQ